MDKSLYYQNFVSDEKISGFTEKLKKYSEQSNTGNPVYVINKPLGDRKYTYDYEQAAAVLVPRHKIIFLHWGENEEKFEDYVEDFLEDLGYISDKYEYRSVLGRPRNWRKEYIAETDLQKIADKKAAEFLSEYRLDTKEKERKGEFLISLLTGSINDIQKTGIDYPETLLDKIKRKIVLFDADQTRFIYDAPRKKRIVIQGLAGTGKTELLLHKMKELYTKESTKIVFTCHNQILADNMRERIPDFFDFMKVQEQIKWQEKLWVMRGWGSKNDKDSGVYSYICHYYGIPFERYSYTNNFDRVCKKAVDYLREKEIHDTCFDYMLIDESQDFTENFFTLCSMVTRETVYIAGDIFQNVFDPEDRSEVNPDFLLNKCYRTDPKTLMCAHAIGMGLFEEGHRLRWLDDKAWEDCGYEIRKETGYYNLYRRPLRRFEDLGNVNIRSIRIIPQKPENYLWEILKIIENLRQENPSLEPDDIGIMFLENTNANYNLSNELKVAIEDRFRWDVNIGYETKEKRKGSLFISNKNNVKGLEFPFVICLMQGDLDDNLQSRNSIYMMLTRSFITSYFLLPDANGRRIQGIADGIRMVSEKGYLHVKEPSEAEKQILNNAIINRTNIYKSQREIADEIMDELKIVNKSDREKIHKMIGVLYPQETNGEKLYEVIRLNYSLME